MLGAGIAALALLDSASALVVSPVEGEVVFGDVVIRESAGSPGVDPCDGIPYLARLQVFAASAPYTALATWTTAVEGPFVVTWRTEGVHPDGEYEIRHSVQWQGTRWDCGGEPWRTLHRVNVQLRNAPAPTLLALEGPAEGYWLENATFVARLTDAESGTPIAGRPVDLSVGSATLRATTDAEGQARATFALTAAPAQTSARADFAGERRLVGSHAAIPFEILPRPTLVAYEGALDAVRGTRATFAARVTDATPGSAREGAPLVDALVRFTLAGTEVQARAGTDGVVLAEATILAPYGLHEIRATYFGEPGRAPDDDASAFDVRWQHVFEDEDGQGAVRLNLVTRELQVATPAVASGVKSLDGAAPTWAEDSVSLSSPAGSVAWRRGTLAFEDDELAIAGRFDLGTRSFVAVARLAGETLLLGDR